MDADDFLTALAGVSHLPSHLPARDADDPSARALAGLAALGQPIRLAVFRLLVRREPDGLAAGAIAAAVGAPHNSLSTHLAILARAGLVSATRSGRSIVYRADLAGMRRLVAFLLADCCGGRPEVCGVITDVLAPTCDCPPVAGESQDTSSNSSSTLATPPRTPR